MQETQRSEGTYRADITLAFVGDEFLLSCYQLMLLFVPLGDANRHGLIVPIGPGLTALDISPLPLAGFVLVDFAVERQFAQGIITAEFPPFYIRRWV
jgi:hypothetical protein